MVRRVWSTGNLLQRDNRGVIKLIPKNEERFLLKNWRPITLLTAGRARWEAEDGILLIPINKVHGSLLLTRMLLTWNKIRALLSWDDNCGELPQHLTILQDGMLSRAGGETWRQRLAYNGIFLKEEEYVRLQRIEEWICAKTLVGKKLHELDGWIWKDDATPFRWEYKTQDWIKKIWKERDFTGYLNSKWRREDSNETWNRRWRLLWVAKVSYRRKIWIWRFLQRGYFTGTRGKGWAADLRKCYWCGQADETLEHMAWECSGLRRRKQDLKDVGLIPMAATSAMTWLDTALSSSGRDPSLLQGFGVYLAKTWEERNNLRFQNKRRRLPTLPLLKQVLIEIESFLGPRSSDRTFQLCTTAKATVAGWILTFTRNRQTQETESAGSDESIPLLQSDAQEVELTQESTAAARWQLPWETTGSHTLPLR
ncbi:hypothetical protein R1sor_013385 [Riccia sorocarpa]|uniref:Reverse transcriptase zinc-binding domain-containing protein n=1 Tax=Riccia sorocarpa TaxID=122646 RepID=A0ABD3H8D8_9MARC